MRGARVGAVRAKSAGTPSRAS